MSNMLANYENGKLGVGAGMSEKGSSVEPMSRQTRNRHVCGGSQCVTNVTVQIRQRGRLGMKWAWANRSTVGVGGEVSIASSLPDPQNKCQLDERVTHQVRPEIRIKHERMFFLVLIEGEGNYQP